LKFDDIGPFGHLVASEIKNGDLVEWLSWDVEDNNLIKNYNVGTVISKRSIISGNRTIMLVQVLCSRTGSTFDFTPFQLRKK